MVYRAAGLLLSVSVLLLSSSAVPSELPPDFDGAEDHAQAPLAQYLKQQPPPPPAVVASRDVDWSTDGAAFRGARLDREVYAGSEFNSGIVIGDADFRQKLEEFTGARETKLHGKRVKISERGGRQGREQARQWLAEQFRALGFQTSEQNFGDGSNFIARKPGAGGKTLILSAHLDSVNNSGADDDGSGIVSALLIANALKASHFKNTLEVVGFDLEELGLVGSQAFEGAMDPNEIMGDIQMDMVSFNGKKDGHFHVIDCDRADSKFLTRGIMGTVQSMHLHLARVSACTDRSDHASFWDKNIPAVAVSENFFGGDHDPCYHKQCDVVDKRLDFKYASSIATAIANTLPGLLKDSAREARAF